MASFAVVLAVYGLLLGFTLNEILGGFARTLKTKRAGQDIRIGWLVPLTAVFVVIEVTGFWSVGYSFQDRLVGDHLTLLAVLAIVGTYYLAASHLFPITPEDWPDYDAWYDRQRRFIFGGMLVAIMLGFAGQYLLDYIRPLAVDLEPNVSEEAAIVELVTLVAILGLLIALLIVKSRKVSLGLLIALIGVDLVSAFGRSAL